MEGNYTRSARIFDILDPDINLIWDKLSELLDMKTEYTWEDWKDIWKTQLENMARAHTHVDSHTAQIQRIRNCWIFERKKFLNYF